MILGLSVVHEVTKNFHAAHVQVKQFGQVEWRGGGEEAGQKLDRRGLVEPYKLSRHLVL